jgi:hypothetical protein
MGVHLAAKGFDIEGLAHTSSIAGENDGFDCCATWSGLYLLDCALSPDSCLGAKSSRTWTEGFGLISRMVEFSSTMGPIFCLFRGNTNLRNVKKTAKSMVWKAASPKRCNRVSLRSCALGQSSLDASRKAA